MIFLSVVLCAIIHAIDKATFLEEGFAGLEQPADQLLPKSAPYCNVELSPKWGYDLEKAKLLNCNAGVSFLNAAADGSSDLSGGAIAGIAIAAVVGATLIALVARMIHGERTGKPLFAPSKSGVISKERVLLTVCWLLESGEELCALKLSVCVY